MSRLGIEILARSIYRELCERGCQGSDVIRLATALLDQILTRKIEPSTEDRPHPIVRLCPDSPRPDPDPNDSHDARDRTGAIEHDPPAAIAR